MKFVIMYRVQVGSVCFDFNDAAEIIEHERHGDGDGVRYDVTSHDGFDCTVYSVYRTAPVSAPLPYHKALQESEKLSTKGECFLEMV